MTVFGKVLVGIYPRSEPLIKAFRAYSGGKMEFEELVKKIREESKEVIDLQLDLNYRYITDGMLRWHDLLRPFAEGLDGIEVDGLSRWFDNNLFYKKPIIVGHVKREKSILNGYIYPDQVPGKRFKLILPDPFTITSLSELRGRRFDEVLFEIAEALRTEIMDVEGRFQVGQVQFASPSLVWKKLDKDDLSMAIDAVEVCVKGVSAEKMLHLPFGDALNAFPEILDVKVDVLGFDMTSTSLRALREYSIDKNVGLGFVDGRNSLMERRDLVKRGVEAYLEVNEPDLVYITPSCGLEYLPRKVADEKVRLIHDIAGALAEE